MGYSAKARFLLYVEKRTDEHWFWIGSKFKSGYGAFSYNGKAQRAHRVSYELFVGPIPEGLCILHKCDIKLCVNPDCLSIGTDAENKKEMWDRGLGPLKGPNNKGFFKPLNDEGEYE